MEAKEAIKNNDLEAVKNLNHMGLSEEKIKEWQDLKDQLPNLQMLDSTSNISKNAKDLKSWVQNEYTSVETKARFYLSNYYPQDADLSFDAFENFFQGRKDLLRIKLIEKFSVVQTTNV